MREKTCFQYNQAKLILCKGSINRAEYKKNGQNKTALAQIIRLQT